METLVFFWSKVLPWFGVMYLSLSLVYIIVVTWQFILGMRSCSFGNTDIFYDKVLIALIIVWPLAPVLFFAFSLIGNFLTKMPEKKVGEGK